MLVTSLVVAASTLFTSASGVAQEASQGHFVGISQVAEATGVRSSEFRPYYRAQSKRAWCWAACVEMVLDYAGVNVNQRAIVQQVYGTDWNGQAPDAPGDFRQMTALLNQWGIDDDGDSFTVHARIGQGAPVPAWLLGELRQNKPVIVLYHPNGPQMGHYVVITGAYFTRTASGPAVNRLVIWDPFPYRQAGMPVPHAYQANVPMTGRFEIDSATLMRTVSFHWFIRATSSDGFEWPDY